MDEEGFFYVVDRKKDLIIAGGFNIYPREVEEVLYEREEIQECIVAGIPDPYRGETVKAYIVLKEGYSITEDELNKYCRQHLAAFKVPRYYEFRDELPKTAVGKILRRALVDEEKTKLANKEAK
jgi:long-chain acyl-CoA synthetase